jgi:type I restriction enzyme S subunit
MNGIKYRKPEEMRDSGIEWLGILPKEWCLVKNKYIAKIKTGSRDTQDSVDDGLYPFYVRSKNVERINSYSFEGEAILTPGDGDIGGIFHYVNEKFDYHQRVYKYSDFKNYCGKYLYYYLMSLFKNKVIGLSAKSTVDSLRLPMLLNFECIKNNLDEQQKIVNFLNIKTAQFDSVIAKKELLIQKLGEAKKSLIFEVVTGKVKIIDGEMVPRQPKEMKDSGVEWLGMIPKDWELKRVKNVAYLKSGDFITAEEIETEGCFPVFGGNGLRGYAEKYNKHGNYILIGRQGALCGNIHYARSKFWASEHTIVVHYIPDINIHWFGELLRIMNLNQYSVTAAQPGISVGMVNNLYIPYPLVYEQQIIGEYIMKIVDKTNGIIKKNKGQIILLKEAKQSLISEAVTGKIDLRDWEITEEGGVQ